VKAIKLDCLGLVFAISAFFACNVAGGSPHWVTRSSDDGSPGSLRYAITTANADGGGKIVFTSVPDPVILHSPLPCLTNISITGPGTISGSNRFRVFCMDSGTTDTLSDLNIVDGVVANLSYPPIADGWGAGISNAGSLTLLNCAIRGCIHSLWV